MSSAASRLSSVEIELVQQARQEGEDLRWEQVEGGGFVCYAGDKPLFSAGGMVPFMSLYNQAMAIKKEEEKLTAKELAVKLLAVMTQQGHSVTWLLKKAELPEEYKTAADLIMPVLAKAGRVKAVDFEGKPRWSLA